MSGATALVRAAIRRDRVRLLVWIAAIVLLVVVTAGSTKGLYPTQASLDDAARAARDNPTALAFNGPDVALDTVGGQVAFQIGAFGLALTGLMSLLLVVRLTRAEEDAGRLELVRALPVGRHAPLAAALLVVGGAQVVVGVLVAGTLLAFDLPAAGSLLLGAAFTAVGLVFAGVAACTAQVTENPRVASGLAGAVLGASFVARAVGDAGSGALSWASPIGWAQKARPYGGDVVWPLLLCLAVAGALVAAARSVEARRDFGAGLIAPRPGPAEASPRLGTPLALAFRLQRGSVVWWTVGSVLLGISLGSLAGSIEEFTKDNDALTDLLAGAGRTSIVDGYLSTSLLYCGLLAGGAVLQILARVRTEEVEHRAEAVLATPTSRGRWAGDHVVAAAVGGASVVVLGGLALGMTCAVTLHDGGQVIRLLAASLVYLPAVGAVAGLAALLVCGAPRWTALAWAAWAACIVLAFFGLLLDVPQLVLDLSPFEAVPSAPGEPVRVLPLVAVGGIAVALAALGFVRLRRRDIG